MRYRAALHPEQISNIANNRPKISIEFNGFAGISVTYTQQQHKNKDYIIMQLFSFIDTLITKGMARVGIRLLRWSIGFIFVWFGGLKFFPGLSPAQELATSTIELLTFGLIPLGVSLFMLASLEVLIGVLLLSGKFMRFTIFLLVFQMAGTMSPIFLFPELVFTQFPHALTIEGQYIFKNFVVISAGIVIGATVRGGELTSEPVRKG